VRTALPIALICLFPTSAQAFTEDICYTLTGVENCYGAIGCSPGKDTPRCTREATTDGLRLLATPGRSLLHMDGTYFLAQAVGFSAEDAHVIASYDEAADIGVYIPYDRSGNAMVDPDTCGGPSAPTTCKLVSRDLSAWTRTSFATGGFHIHMSAPYNPDGDALVTGVDGQHPDPTDPVHEASMRQLRDWVYGDQETACTVGFTVPSSHGDISTGDRCAEQALGGQAWMTGEIPLLGGATVWLDVPLGEQVIVDDDHSTEWASAFDDLDDPQLAKAGVYMHMLQDRVSHHNCGDLSVSYPDPTSPGDFVFDYADVECGAGPHALWHSWEIGQPQAGLDPKFQNTVPALELSYRELSALAGSRGLTTRVDEATAVAALAAALEVVDAGARIDAVQNVISDHGLTRLPGH